ncbi:hypothetical protein [Thiobacillus sp.]|uniref:hypothetical protein n=1 Tax=Thiobacillus sp. TaxID=924 RepID=UPI0025E397A2|nr:hypothetical protein [Thiobacillus sp.]
MSLLLKALKQAEAAHPGRLASDKSDPDSRIEGDLELEPALPGTAKAREWVEPPGLLFGNSEPVPGTSSPRLRWPQLSRCRSPPCWLSSSRSATGYTSTSPCNRRPPCRRRP